MKVEIVESTLLPRHVAARLGAQLREAVAARGIATLALSGGGGLEPTFTELADLHLPWGHIHVFQVDERIAPDGHEDRNWTAASQQFLARLPRPPAGAHPMPVVEALEGDDAAEEAADRYREVLEDVTGHPAVLDVVHLGLGEDGHTASLIPGDPVLEVDDRDVAVTGTYRGRRRMTLTYPALARARQIVWLVSGESKAEVVGQLVRGDSSIPASQVRRDTATLLIDPRAAAVLR